MRFPLAALLVGVAALCALQPGWAKPHVTAAGGGTMLVVREVESTDVDLVQAVGDTRFPARDEDNDVATSDDQTDEAEFEDSRGFVVELDVDDATVSTSTAPPTPPPRCHLRWCWKSCTKRGYNWGLCLCKKCHCYY